jgi:transcriptional regulator with XRE-family HTH domain
MKPKDIGSIVKTRRAELDMTTTVLAKKVKISQAQISRLENGQQGFRSGTLVKIAEALKVPPFRLFMTNAEWARWLKRK